MGEGRRQETGDRKQETGDRRQETGDRRNGEFRVGRSKNYKNDFSAQLLPKIRSFLSMKS
ncbi:MULTISPECIES: hypothetical protein [Okeania]|uniref:Uncharacterized protein n=1 Tax=Okeania hirsuta TaxID=1458930 RepID=A0A3N6PT89_9CYAN|nr:MULTISPECIES: hypothetical protein [Okeania]NET78826.1 hypothetical protein [Okeania sp. SIO1F9]NES78559.1 hypothetical protein [Okeania sp. SIO1H4]NET21968.1 hypothetical protein [Okeania sp. SIO1H5]NET97402.1 hypothetical protein [Okeania sp. SIO1H2]RQH40950.1 hypothetical protein D5R40_15450 [Okeania hirsuta]